MKKILKPTFILGMTCALVGCGASQSLKVVDYVQASAIARRIIENQNKIESCPFEQIKINQRDYTSVINSNKHETEINGTIEFDYKHSVMKVTQNFLSIEDDEILNENSFSYTILLSKTNSVIALVETEQFNLKAEYMSNDDVLDLCEAFGFAFPKQAMAFLMDDYFFEICSFISGYSYLMDLSNMSEGEFLFDYELKKEEVEFRASNEIFEIEFDTTDVTVEHHPECVRTDNEITNIRFESNLMFLNEEVRHITNEYPDMTEETELIQRCEIETKTNIVINDYSDYYSVSISEFEEIIGGMML